MKVINIEWDSDGEVLELPSEVEVPTNLEIDDIANYLSDTYGFCVLGFEVE